MERRARSGWRPTRAWPLVLAAIAIAGCGRDGASVPPPSLEVARVMDHVRVLTDEIGPRPAASAAAGRAADHVRGQLAELGLTADEAPVGDLSLPAITVGSMIVMPAARLSFEDPNLWVRFGPPALDGEAILVMAHYDTVSGSPGAVDNAASVGLLLELAAALASTPPPRPIILAWTAAEEQRLAGAEALAPRLEDEVGLAVSLDLIGAGGELTLNGLSEHLGARWLRWLARVARRAAVSVHAPLPHRVISRHLPQLERSDHGPFTRRGVPALHLYHRGAGNIYLPYHTPRDVAAEVDRGAVDDAGRLLVALVYETAALPAPGGDPGMWLPLPGGIVAPGALIVAIEALLLAVVILGLVVGWRRRSRTPAPRPVLGAVVLIAGYAVALGGAAAALRLAAAVRAHPAPWVHSPGRHLVAALLVAAAVALLWWLPWRRARPFGGAFRFLAPGVCLAAALGVALVVAGAFELAWLPLWSAAALAAMAVARCVRWRAVLFALSIAPLFAAFDPALLRESIFHGFWPGVSLVMYAGLFASPAVSGVAYLATSVSAARATATPLPGWLLCAAALVLAGVGIVLLVAVPPPCTGETFVWQGLSCELHR